MDNSITKIQTSNHWVNDERFDSTADEREIQPQNLASFIDLAKLGARYWGGVSALLIMIVLMLSWVALVVNETLYEKFRQSVALSVDALSEWNLLAFLQASWLFWLVLFVVLLGYWLLIRLLPTRRSTIHAWGLAFLVVLLATMDVKVNVELINWSGAFWEDIKNKDVPKFAPGLLLFAQLAFFAIIAFVYRNFFQQLLQIRWRTWLVENFTQRYLLNKRYHFLAQQGNQDNPDQRISDDLDKFTDVGMTLFFGLFVASLSIYEYSNALIKISGPLEFDWLGKHIYIPDYMFWAVVAYTLVGSTLIHFVGRRLVRINMLKERYNANFRYHLVRAREYSEGIAFMKGEEQHIQTARGLFSAVRGNWWQMMLKFKQLSLGVSAYGQLAHLFVLLVAVPRYFSGGISFGGVMQVIRAFGELQQSLAWFISNYDQLSALRASASRILNLETALNAVDAYRQQSSLVVLSNNTGGVALTHVALNRPQFDEHGVMHEQAQVANLDWQISQGQRWLVTGASGSGKSTILRAIAALWPYGRGQIDVPAKAKVQFLPQRPYFPIASLRDALAYPLNADAYKDAAYEAVLEMAQLEHLKERLSETTNWGQILSGGEQQRLAFARVFLQRPDYLFLDEATASLDIANETALYATLLEFLPNLTLVSISHHEQLKAYHNHGLNLSADELGGFKASLQ